MIGAAYFEKLAIDYGWIGERARIIQGAVLGLALIAAGLQFARRGFAFYGQVMSGGGGAILYLSTYAAFTFYSLIGRAEAFTLMVAITALIAWLADRQRSQGLALFGVGGGFATPFLLPGTTDAQIALFTYDAILIGGTAVLAHRRDWPFVNLVSYLFTLLTIAAWADRFYTPGEYLRTEIYLTIFCAMFLYIASECRRAATDAGRVVWLMLCTAPFAYYLASLAILADHDTALLVWLVLVMLAGGIAATRTAAAAGLGVWVAVATPLLIWCATPVAQGLRRDGLDRARGRLCDRAPRRTRGHRVARRTACTALDRHHLGAPQPAGDLRRRLRAAVPRQHRSLRVSRRRFRRLERGDCGGDLAAAHRCRCPLPRRRPDARRCRDRPALRRDRR